MCEAYLQIEPTVTLFREFFYINKQTECADGPSLELGGVSIQRRRDTAFPAALLPSHPKGWNKTWFYYKNTTPEGENPLPGYRPSQHSTSTKYPGWASQEEREQIAGIYPRLRALLANGLTGVDLVRCCVSWRILPLSHYGSLMCTYMGEPTDPQQYHPTNLKADEINATVKSLLREPQEACNKTGLKPFYASNPAPAISTFVITISGLSTLDLNS